MCNPYYASYIGAALAVNAEPWFLNATKETGHLPSLDELAADMDRLQRLAAFYLATPANPQGTIASREYIGRALELARAHNFMLFVDECYSEIYSATAPAGGLEVAAESTDRFCNLVVFNSLSKRSNLPGLRSGFCAGDADFLDRLAGIRNLIAPQVSGPIQHASAAAWSDETHVEANRLSYQKKYAVCDQLIGDKYGYQRPDGGFFAWLDMHQFWWWRTCGSKPYGNAGGVRVIPGAYLAQPDHNGINPGASYIRLALIHDLAKTRDALERIASSLV